MEPTIGQVTDEFRDSLLSRRDHALRKVASVVTTMLLALTDTTRPTPSGSVLYTAVLRAYEQGRLRKSRRTKPLKSTKKARFHSTLQVLTGLCERWPGLTWQTPDKEVSWGLRLTWSSGNLEIRKVITTPMKPNPKATDVVYSFYDFLNRSRAEWKKAWDLLAMNYQQERWGSSFKRFEDGYSAFRTIQNLQVFQRRSEPHLATFDVFYEEEQDQQSIIPLKVIQELTVRKIRRDLLNLLDDLERDFTEAGGTHDRFDSIVFSHFFHADAAVALPWTMDIDPDRLKSVYPITENKTLSRGRRIRVENQQERNGEYNDVWRIKKITWLSI